MTDLMPPRFTRPGFSGQDVPFYGVTFDKHGTLKSPQAQATVVQRLADGDYTDVIIFSHGWNNDWDDAVAYYKGLLDGLGAMANSHSDDLPTGIKPMMIGIGWPSAALVWPSERTPDIAAGAPVSEIETFEDTNVEDIVILCDGLTPDNAARVKDMLDGAETLSASDIDELAQLIAPGFVGGGSDEVGKEEATAEALAAMLKSPELAEKAPEAEEEEDEDEGFLPGVGGGHAADAQAAGVFSELFGLRKVIRLATVRKMKDRAGVVGGAGVADLVSTLLADTHARVHIVGHSYGCKVMLTAAVAANTPRQITSALLLQPAINYYAFSEDIGDGREGGFRPALAQVKKPILATKTNDDFPLRHVFHLANNRRKDFGEAPAVAGLLDKYYGMGGYGPAGLSEEEEEIIEMPDPGDAYPDTDATEVLTLAATGKIQGHSDILVPWVFWAMLQNLTTEA